MNYDYLIVGAGLFGSVFAHEIKKAGKSCKVIDRRSNALCYGAVCFGFCESLNEFVADVASIEVGEYEHICMAGYSRSRSL